jgi:uncharacterized protein YdeI (YjbR/CyaY-like superfamily)
MSARHFASAAEFRDWLENNHASTNELHVAFHRKSSGRGGLTYPEAVDEALCFGWIDGIVRKLDAARFSHRFTPRKPGSHWSNVNARHVARLTAAGRMQAAGLAAFAARRAERTGTASYERPPATLPSAFAKKFRAQRAAWKFFSAQPPGYRRLLIHKIVTPKQPATRERWLARVIAASAAGRRLP